MNDLFWLLVGATLPILFALPIMLTKREWVGLTEQEQSDIAWENELHEKAATYATNRKDAYIEAMKQGKVEKHTQDELLWIWVAHYEGYREGYWRAKGDDRYTTDPVRLKERGA